MPCTWAYWDTQQYHNTSIIVKEYSITLFKITNIATQIVNSYHMGPPAHVSHLKTNMVNEWTNNSLSLSLSLSLPLYLTLRSHPCQPWGNSNWLLSVECWWYVGLYLEEPAFQSHPLHVEYKWYPISNQWSNEQETVIIVISLSLSEFNLVNLTCNQILWFSLIIYKVCVCVCLI